MPRNKYQLFAGALLVLLWCGATRASEVAVHSILATPAKFDHQQVQLEGNVIELKETTSHARNDYTTFKLQDASGSTLTIFIWGHPALANGERVRVDGVFETEHHAGQYTFYNEVEASHVTPSP
jgi:hypothetical protein